MRRPALLVVALVAPALLAAPQALAPTALAQAAPVVQPRTIDAACPDGQIQEDGFPDVAASNVHERSVDCVVQWQVAAGRTASSYGPGSPVERGQMASFIARLIERSGGTLPAASRDHFADDGASTHQVSINRLAEAGIVGGTGAGTYAPRSSVSRAQMAAFLTRAYDYRAAQAERAPLAAGADHFRDDDTSPLEAEIDKAAAAGFTGGFPDGTYRPQGLVLRDQMAAFLARTLDLVVTEGMAAVPPGARALTATEWRPYASVGPVVLHAPGELVELVGFHQSNHDGAQPQQVVEGSVRSLVLPSRSRETDLRSAADIVVDPSKPVRSPVTGTVLRAGSYVLYCDYDDSYLVIRPDSRPGYEVKVLHFEGLRVRAGDRVEAGVTVVGGNARILPFRSQVDDHTAAPHWSHLHVEVVDTGIPDRPGGGPGC